MTRNHQADPGHSVMAAAILAGRPAASQQTSSGGPRTGARRAPRSWRRSSRPPTPTSRSRSRSPSRTACQNRVLTALRSGSPPDLIEIQHGWIIPIAATGTAPAARRRATPRTSRPGRFRPGGPRPVATRRQDLRHPLPRRDARGLLQQGRVQGGRARSRKPPKTWTELVEVSTQAHQDGERQAAIRLRHHRRRRVRQHRLPQPALHLDERRLDPLRRHEEGYVIAEKPAVDGGHLLHELPHEGEACRRPPRSRTTAPRCGACSSPTPSRSTSPDSSTSPRSRRRTRASTSASCRSRLRTARRPRRSSAAGASSSPPRRRTRRARRNSSPSSPSLRTWASTPTPSRPASRR